MNNFNTMCGVRNALFFPLIIVFDFDAFVLIVHLCFMLFVFECVMFSK